VAETAMLMVESKLVSSMPALSTNCTD